MERIQQQQDGTDTNNTTQDEGVSPLPKVDTLDQAVHSRKTIFEKSLLRSYLEEASLVKSHRNHKNRDQGSPEILTDGKKTTLRESLKYTCQNWKCPGRKQIQVSQYIAVHS